MSKPITGRRITVDVLLSGGRIRLDLTQPTDAQLARITKLLEEWLDDEKHPWQPPVAARPADSPRSEPIHGESLPVEQRTLLAKVTGRGTRGGRYDLCGAVHAPTGHKCRRQVGHDGNHGWWGPGASHNWTGAEPQPEESEPESEKSEPEPDAETVADAQAGHGLDVLALEADAPAGIYTGQVALCRCGHAERMHEKDDADGGRGVCFHGGCGCAEYRTSA